MREIMSDCILKMEHITQRFPGVLALDDVSFELKQGEIHALVGENGAGKSTLMKVLTGVNRPNEGNIRFDGKEYHSFDIEESKKAGINMIYQELNLIPKLKVYENIFLGKEILNAGRLDRPAMIRKAEKLIQKLGIQMDVNETIENLTMAYRQMTEIARALLDTPKILIMDEPTAPLTSEEVKILFQTIRVLKEQQVSIIYISHRMEEIFELCDRCTVFRDGRYIRTMDVKDTDVDELIRLMVGRNLENQYPPRIPTVRGAGTLLEVQGITNKSLKNVSFTLKSGEILGLGGLVGAGRTETLRAVFGCDSYKGRILKNGKEISISSPKDAIRHGIVLVTEDRKGQGLLMNLSVSDNMVLPVLSGYLKGLFLSRKNITGQVEENIRRLNIKTPSKDQLAAFLSGGNQQKVIIARWLLTEADIILFDEPTRGIDVGAKYEIYSLMNELKLMGKSIIMVSSDMPELMGMSDRIIVMAEGRITGQLENPEEFEQEAILRHAADI